jgi:anti-sigma B factor antagonist
MKIKARSVRDIAIVEIEGRIPGETEKVEIQEVMSGLLAGGTRKAVIDLSKTEWMASTGLGALIGSKKSYDEANAELLLAGLTSRIKELVVITRLTEAYDIHDSVEEALTAFKN